jgi:hypothetical protein
MSRSKESPKTKVPAIIKELQARYADNRAQYEAVGYKEFRLRKEFLDPLIEALGWDVGNVSGYAEAYKEVIHEDSLLIGKATKAPDYAIRVGGVRKFFIEAKSPSTNLKDDEASAFQLRRYGWSAKLSLCILTNFRHTAVYDCRIKPEKGDNASTARVLLVGHESLVNEWPNFLDVFSKDAVLKGSFDRFAADSSKKRGTATVDEAFLEEIEDWRSALAKNIALRNKSIDIAELNMAVQSLIDRIVFLRIAEDRGFEPYGTLKETSEATNIYAKLTALFRRADDRYNSGLFHFNKNDGLPTSADSFTLKLEIDDLILRPILKGLYFPESPYEFGVLPADILGQVYEQFLGKVIRFYGKSAVVEEKPEVKKSGGVFYTPTHIVRAIVSDSLGRVLQNRSVTEVAGQNKSSTTKAKLTILDPACGSGSFLIEAYQYLLDWYLEAYIKSGPKKHARGSAPKLFDAGRDDWRLTIAEKRRILLDHIFGIDIDPQAVEVTKLSLLMKVLEGEKNDRLAAQMNLFNIRALPDLGDNVVCGNTLIDRDIYGADLFSITSEQEKHLNPLDWASFKKAATGGKGFDAIIGNPPYVLLQDKNRDVLFESYVEVKYTTARFKLDTYALFIERSLGFLAHSGVLSFIVPSNFLTNNHAVELRKMLIKDGHLSHILNFSGRVFRKASVDTCIFCYDSSISSREFKFIAATASPEAFQIAATSKIQVSPILKTPGAVIATATKMDRTLLDVISRGTRALGTFAAVNFGKQLRDRNVHTKDVISLGPRDKVPDGYARCYTGKDIGFYKVTWGGLACRTTEIAKRGGCWDDDKQNARNKLLCKQIGRFPTFGIDERGYQCLNTMFMINPADSDSAYYLLGLLNSKVIRYCWMKKFNDHRKTFPKIKGTYLKLLPIAPVTRNPTICKQIGDLAKQIIDLLAVKSGSKTETELRRQQTKRMGLAAAIDELVFQLYELTGENKISIESFVDALE